MCVSSLSVFLHWEQIPAVRTEKIEAESLDLDEDEKSKLNIVVHDNKMQYIVSKYNIK